MRPGVIINTAKLLPRKEAQTSIMFARSYIPGPGLGFNLLFTFFFYFFFIYICRRPMAFWVLKRKRLDISSDLYNQMMPLFKCTIKISGGVTSTI